MAKREPEVRIFVDAAGEWRYSVIAKNGEVLVTSEGYTRYEDALRGFKALTKAVRALWKSI